jgi:hypothetical protein
MQRMKELVDSLSIWSGALVVAVVSGAVVWLLASMFPALRKLWVVIVPFTVAFCLYWSPVWLGADPSEYHAWALVFIVPWFLAGAIPAAAIDARRAAALVSWRNIPIALKMPRVGRTNCAKLRHRPIS